MSLEELLKNLRRDYLTALPSKITAIERMATESLTHELKDAFHKLKGTGRTYGVPEVSELSKIVEDICIQVPDLAPRAAEQASHLLKDIHLAHHRSESFDLKADPRFEEICRLLPP